MRCDIEYSYTPEDLEDHGGVAAVIKDRYGHILVQKHNKFGFWTIPVGKVKPGQETEDALKEELYEECGITIKSWKEIAHKDFVYLRKGKDVTIALHLYEILEYSGEIKNMEPQKHNIQEFKAIDEIIRLPYLSDNTLLFLESIGIIRDALI